MSRHSRYAALFEGPQEDGKQTWFCLGRDIPPGFDRRIRYSQGWQGPVNGPRGGCAQSENDLSFFQVREHFLPDPEGYQTHMAGDDIIVTTTWIMYDRDDTDQWDIHLPKSEGGDWVPLDKHKHLGPQSTFHGVTVRRRKP